MSGHRRQRGLAELLLERWSILRSIIADTLFLAVWLGILWLFDLVTSRIVAHGDLEWSTAKAMLAVSTLAVIVLYLYWDIRTVYIELRLSFERRRRMLTTEPTADAASGGGDATGTPQDSSESESPST